MTFCVTRPGRVQTAEHALSGGGGVGNPRKTVKVAVQFAIERQRQENINSRFRTYLVFPAVK